jgi:hypothetical protein
MIMSQDERMAYLADHYWDNFNFNDTTLIHNADYTEQGFVDFIGFLRYLNMPAAQQAMATMMSKAAANKTTFDYFAKISELYLYEPQSPYKNDELYNSSAPICGFISSARGCEENTSPLSAELGNEETVRANLLRISLIH